MDACRAARRLPGVEKGHRSPIVAAPAKFPPAPTSSRRPWRKASRFVYNVAPTAVAAKNGGLVAEMRAHRARRAGRRRPSRLLARRGFGFRSRLRHGHRRGRAESRQPRTGQARPDGRRHASPRAPPTWARGLPRSMPRATPPSARRRWCRRCSRATRRPITCSRRWKAGAIPRPIARPIAPATSRSRRTRLGKNCRLPSRLSSASSKGAFRRRRSGLRRSRRERAGGALLSLRHGNRLGRLFGQDARGDFRDGARSTRSPPISPALTRERLAHRPSPALPGSADLDDPKTGLQTLGRVLGRELPHLHALVRRQLLHRASPQCEKS